MRLLYVTDGFPYPLTSGALRHYFLIRELSFRHEVTLLALVGPAHTDADAAAMRPLVARQVRVRVPDHGGPRTQIQRARSVLGGALDSGWMREARETATSLMEEGRFDAVLLSGKRTATILGTHPRVPVVADLCDATSSRVRGRLRVAPVHERVGIALQYANARRLERALLRNSQHAVFISARDRNLVLRRVRSHPPTSIVANGVDVEFWQRRTPALGTDQIIFTGKMDYPPNEDAALILVNRVLPLVRRDVPSATVCIAGRDPGPRVRKLGAVDGVTVTGLVDDLRPYLEKAAVFAAPLRFGAGMQNKVLEALAMGVPVVTSPLVAAGLRGPNGEAPPVASVGQIERFAALVVQHLRAAAEHAAPHHEGRRFVRQHFDWQSSGAALEDALQAASPGSRRW